MSQWSSAGRESPRRRVVRNPTLRQVTAQDRALGPLGVDDVSIRAIGGVCTCSNDQSQLIWALTEFVTQSAARVVRELINPVEGDPDNRPAFKVMQWVQDHAVEKVEFFALVGWDDTMNSLTASVNPATERRSW